MNKTVFHLVIIVAGLLAISCAKKETSRESYQLSNRLIPIESESGAKTQSYLMTYNIGHSGKGCKGCVQLAGIICHVDCMGYGDECSKTVAISLNQVGTGLTATTIDTFDLTSEDFFLMPDRSLDYTDEHNNRVFLNIPEQLVYRDTATKQFTFTGLFITSTPAYSNN